MLGSSWIGWWRFCNHIFLYWLELEGHREDLGAFVRREIGTIGWVVSKEGRYALIHLAECLKQYIVSNRRTQSYF